MAEEGERDLILANFQAASGIENIDECIVILNQHDWDLLSSLNSVVPDSQEPQELNVRHVPAVVNLDPPIVDLDPPDIVDVDMCDSPLRDVVTTDNSVTWKRERQLKFSVEYLDRTIPVIVTDDETVATIKRMLEIQTGITQDQMQVSGWPCSAMKANDQTVLSTLNLAEETKLVLQSPRVTSTPLEYLPCNVAGSSRGNHDRSIRVPNFSSHHKSPASSLIFTLVVLYDKKEYNLKYPGNKTVREVKQGVHSITGVTVRDQDWTGWPSAARDETQLGEANLDYPSHRLSVTSKKGSKSNDLNQEKKKKKMKKNVKKKNDLLFQGNSGLQIINLDSGMDASYDDSEPEEHVISDDDDEMFDPEPSLAAKKLRPMLPMDSEDTSDALVQFVHEFEERYGDFHPVFYMGPLDDAITEAQGPTVRDRKPLLIYLHHDGSIVTNIFCSQVLCSDTIITYISQNCVIWGWDMTHASNRARLVNMVIQHFGNAAGNTVMGFKNDEYPLLLIVMKTRSALEVCSVLRANTSIDEIMTGLMNGYEVFQQAMMVEIREEDERIARESVKKEQDLAYQESLAADRAKAQAEQERVQAEEEARKQAEFEAQLKEAHRQSVEDQLPEEPSVSCSKPTTNLLFRLPGGQRASRRFLASDKMQVLLMYVTTKGYDENEYKMLTNFPRREEISMVEVQHQLKREDSQKTLQELGLCPQETIFVEER